jgi:hypothetical protein
VRARRTLAKDTPHGKTVVRAFQNNVVGPDPFKLEMKVGTWVKKKPTGQGPKVNSEKWVFEEEEELNRAIEFEWGQFLKKENFTVRKNMSFMEAMRMVEAECVAPGSVLCRLYDTYEFNRWGFAVDFLEEDRLQETYIGFSPPDGAFGGGNPIRGSVELHPRYNFALAYWILRRHPGEAYSTSGLIGDRGARFGVGQRRA